MERSVARQELLDLIDKELSAHEQCIKALKARRNAAVCISTLPPELLIDIFLLVRSAPHVKQWHQITHVCQHWRQLAIGTPFLWTRPPTQHHEYTNLMLERSQMADLDIFFNSQASQSTISTVLNHIGRIRSLRMDMMTPQLDHVYSHILSSGHIFSRLESLTIMVQDKWDVDASSWIFPSALIQGSSSFHSLRLSKVAVGWQVLTSVNLSSLDLYHTTFSERITAKTLLHSLKSMSRLQRLSMSLDKLLAPESPPTTHTEKTALPHLQHLSIGDCFPAHIPYLLDHLDLPCLNLLEVDVDDLRNKRFYSSKALTPVISTLFRGAFPVGRRLMISQYNIHVSASGAPNPFFRLDLPPMNNQEDGILRGIELLRLMAPLFADLTQLDLCLPLSSDNLSELFGSKHQLKAITLSDYSDLLTSFAGALSACPCIASATGAHTFAALDTVCLEGILWDGVDPRVVVNFCSAILSRSAHTVAFKTIYWWDYYVLVPDWVKKLLQTRLTCGGTHVNRGLVPPEYGC